MDQSRFRDERINFLVGQNYTHCGSLAFNNHFFFTPTGAAARGERTRVTYDMAREKLKGFHARVDRKLIGTRYNKASPEQRTNFVAYVEHASTNFHFHILWHVPEERIAKFEMLFPENERSLWNELIPSGSHKFWRITNLERDANYCTKSQHFSADWKSEIWSVDFLPNK